MGQTTRTQSGEPGRVISWTSFSHQYSYMDFVEIFNVALNLSILYLYILLNLVGVELPLCMVVIAVILSWSAIACFLKSS